VKRNNRKAKLMINFFSDAKEFYRTSGAGGGALAYFMFLGDYDLCVFYDRLDFEFTEMVLYHELSHYLQKLVNEDFKVPHWPGEGMAEFYGGALWDVKKKRLDIGLLQEGRLSAVKNDISLGERLKLRDVITKDAYTDYTWGWTLVHFLMNSEHRAGFQKYFKGIANAKGVNRALGPFNLKTVTPEESLRYFMECLKISDEEGLKALEQAWYDYIDKDLVLEGASGLEKAAVGALNVGKRLRAKRLFQEAVDAGSTSAVMYHRYAQLIDSEDRKKAIDLYRKAVEFDPLTGTYWYEMGKLVKRDDEEEGARMMALGKEMDPEVDAYEWDLGDFTGEDDE
jgi:tetratricopeptide (TPR) repeat protein